MPGNTEEKEKCLEKLNQMQKFIPFLDFMIEKISKNNYNLSLESQLSKLQVLRSMIVEKSEKYSWEIIIKVEDVIQRLISMLDFKECNEKFSECFDDISNERRKTSMATTISIVPSSATTVSASDSHPATVDAKPQELSRSNVDIIMKTLKVPVEPNKIGDRDKELLSNPLGTTHPLDISGKPMETDLDKDLDGYDLTDCPSLSERNSSNAIVDSVPEKVSSHDDLLSSSREKLLKSLQSRLFPCRTNLPFPQSPAGDKTERTSEPQITSAFSRSQTNLGEPKSKSDYSESSDSNGFVDESAHLKERMSPRKRVSFTWKRTKTVKSVDSSESPTSEKPDLNLKQKLKEKLSSYIFEIYRVPGKSVGGSLRSLKESKDVKKLDEDELFKPDVVYSSLQSKSQRRDSAGERSQRDSLGSEKKSGRNNNKSSHKYSTRNSDNDKRADSKSSRSGESDSKSRSHKRESNRGDNGQKKSWDLKCAKDDKKPSSKKVEDKNFALDKLNDEELLEFVKENMQSLPHLAKLKSSELRKAVQSSFCDSAAALDADAVSEISDDSFHDADVLVSGESEPCASESSDKCESKEVHFLASTKIAQVGPDDVAKSAKPIVEPSKDTKVVDEFGDKTDSINNSSFDDSLSEDAYAMKLIEDTTSSTSSCKKKGLLELPMPVTDDLFDDISAVGSFEPSSSPSESRDPRLAKLSSADSRNKSGSNNKLESNSPDASKVARELWMGRPSTNLSKSESSHSSKSQNIFMGVNVQMQRNSQDRSDPLLCKPLTSHGLSDVSQLLQPINRYPSESNDPRLRNPVNAFFNNDPRRHVSLPSEPKSYAEYKRMKRYEQEKLNQQSSKESPKSNLPDASDAGSWSLVEKDDGSTAKKNQDPRHSGYKDSIAKQTNPKSYPSARGFGVRKNPPHSKQWRHSDHSDSRERRGNSEEGWKEEGEKSRKTDEKRYSSESEELISPLEELYRSEEKPKTGRGYGIQNFKIPKKVRRPYSPGPSKPNKNWANADNGVKSDTRTEASNVQSEVDPTKRVKESGRAEELEKGEVSQANATESTKDSVEKSRKNLDRPEPSSTTLVDSTVSEDVPSKGVERVECNVECTKTDSSIIEKDSVNCDRVCEKTELNENPVSDSVSINDATPGCGQVERKTDLSADKTDVFEQTSNLKNVAEEKMVTTKSNTERLEKCDTQIVECDSNVESSSLNEQNGKDSVAPADKNTTMQKEEITQEFVEALIRKSFQSGEGKLLLAQVKLFEEFARKLNSKKLKTIQKIINSESGSSSSSEASSEDEKKKKKSKKSDQKSKKRKKKGRKSRKHKLSSSSSCSESEESSEEESCDKKEVKTSTTKSETSDVPSTSEEAKTKTNEPSGLKSKGSKRRGGRRGKQKPNQNKLLEEVLDESPQREDSISENPADAHTTQTQPKKRAGRTKGKTKTELDRLHDDIRSMFISAGVVTATGRRMCRILKQSGGNMNNLDIVKESAKMVEEEKLKKVQTRAGKSPRGGSSENGSQFSEKGTKVVEIQQQSEEEDPKLRLSPRVYLQRVDLDNFGYGIKVSEDCISFRRMKGRNTAIRGGGTMLLVEKSRWSSPARNVFLFRNKRKFERLRDSKCKKVYTGKKLMDIVKNLPLKMAKMKHLQICERKTEVETCSGKNIPENSARQVEDEVIKRAVKLSNSELQCYAFEKKRKIYICKLCSHITRHITTHYNVAHGEHEILISRLCLEEAKAAKLESEKNGYDLKNSLTSSMKRKGKPPSSRSGAYRCRMCGFSRTGDVNSFAAHVSTHTGEYRYQCPREECGVKVHSRDAVKFHILDQHSKSRYELYNKIIHVYPLAVEADTLFGYLCSLCHFVQIRRCNLEKHISIQHNSSDDAKIIKINMSAAKYTRLRKIKENPKSDSKETSPCSNNIGSEDEESKQSDTETGHSREVQQVKNTEENCLETKSKKRKQRSDDESSEGESDASDIELLGSKRVLLDEKAEVVEVNRESGNVKRKEKGPLAQEEEIDVEGDEHADDDNLNSDVDVEDCVDLKGISNLKGSDIISSMETPETGEKPVRSKPDTIVSKLKVGPLAALLSPNSEVLYECYVKGCLFSTIAFDLFEKHIKISHWKTKWNGVCDICRTGKDNAPRAGNSFKLLTALNHLKLHARGRNAGGKLSAKDLIMELKLLTPSQESPADEGDDESAEDEAKDISEVKEQMSGKTDTSEKSFPVKPLLRVRNLIGDRLSTPKAEENDVLSVNEESSNGESSTDSSKMFTIENVRSLTESPAADNEIKIEQVCSLKDLMSKPAPQLSSGKTILVRSCPTRKIAIRPEPSALSVDVGTINVVQPPVVGHPVVLSPLSSTSPIRIISTALSSNPTFTVKPIVVSPDTVRLSAPNLMPVIGPSLSPTITTTTILPVNTNENSRMNAEAKTVSQKQPTPQENSPGGADLLASKIGLDVEVITSPTRSKSPGAGAATAHHLSKNSSSDVEDVDEKDTISPQRFASSPNTGKKSVKDAKIYKEMLTKTKLCHLFKCMGIECSFTCNNENVFTQHIGLHEAQRRLKRNKGLKTIYLRSANKTTRAFYWQQCAYCCEVLSNTNKALSHHILEEHGHCMYQCAFCFYRAVSHCYVEIHQNLAHSQILKTTPRVIYKCKPLKVPPSQIVALEKHGRKQSVRPYHCDQCGRKFYITNEFTSHLQTEHQSVTAYTCHICKNLCFKVNRLINHYKLHSYSTYQCAYCLHGTETEKEMIFHLCNFHFSQPAIMYVRALAEGQSCDEKQKLNKKKKHLSNQLDSLKVIVYESENPNLDCIVEADPDEEIPENISESSLDLSSIVAELGIYTESQSSTSGATTPLIKELASIGDKSTKHLTVKTLLPNAQFSSENENGAENCSVLISSGLSIPSDQDNEREMNIPLGQLPLEAVNVQHKETAPASSHPNNVGSPDRNLKLNEIIVNLQHKDKSLTLPAAEEEKVGQPAVKHSSAVHKLPPVVLGRSSVVKNAYPSKNAIAKKKSQEESQGSESTDKEKVSGVSEKAGAEKEVKVAEVIKTQGVSQSNNSSDTGSRKPSVDKQPEVDSETTGQPLITNVVSLSGKDFDEGGSTKFGDDSIIISDICSLSTPSAVTNENSNSSGVVISIKSTLNVGSVLKPPVIRLEDFRLDEDTKKESNENIPKLERRESAEEDDKKSEKTQDDRPSSPDVIILEDEKGKDIVTVTLDSDDEKEENVKKQAGNKSKGAKEASKSSAGNETIRKEMELLRNQIANETDSLLLDEETEKPTRDLTLNVKPGKPEGDPSAKTLLSPIEEAICSLNKKLESENQEAQKKVEEEKKEKVVETRRKSEGSENKAPERPRTRFGGRKENVAENVEKSEGDDSSNKKESGAKFRRFKGELTGKELFICGNVKCNFAAENDAALRDHLYVCDLSRESSVLVCPHCSRQIKQFRPYLEHLKYHGEKRFHCGLCSFSSAVDISVSNHVKQKHKCAVTKILPKESKEDHFVYYPKNYKVEKIDFEVNGYSPGDEDKLPLQSVYQVNVKCAKCPYFTKVRSNMVRHLKIHVKSVETEGVVVVPSTAPTNPVPCLETKERMFDKMTNLAASSQLAQAKDKTALESLSPEEEAKLPQFVAEQMRYKCCLPDCNYITVDDGMLKHHIKALHDEINYYSCPHCRVTVHVDVRHVTLDKIGFHLKHHDTKLYKCPHCIYFHFQKNVVEKHTAERHPDRRFFVHVVREPKLEVTSEEEPSSSEGGARVWKCGLCEDFQTPSKSTLMDHLMKTHNTKSKYKCKFCSMKGNSYPAFSSHFASKHPGEKVSYLKLYYTEKVAFGNLESHSGNSSGADSSNEHFDTTPLWQRGAPRIRHIRGILIEEEEIKTKKSKKTSVCESEAETSGAVTVSENVFYCPLCTNKKKPFYTRNEDCFRTHLYQELNYQQFACILCGKMFVDRKDFERHHSRFHSDKPQSLKQTKEDHEIKFWVDQVIAKQRKQMEERKRKMNDTEEEEDGNPGPPKKKKEV